jgi:antitoxin (DNA-binding transcriptional repressor) of toxin-antitoxin stability system
MSTRTVAENESNLSELLDQVIDGEGLVITRDGQPVAELKPVPRRMLRESPQPEQETEDEFLKLLREIPQHIKDAAVADVRAIRRRSEDDDDDG